MCVYIRIRLVLQHYADYSLIYGSLGAARLAGLEYMVSLVILVGAEFNAMLFRGRCWEKS